MRGDHRDLRGKNAQSVMELNGATETMAADGSPAGKRPDQSNVKLENGEYRITLYNYLIAAAAGTSM